MWSLVYFSLDFFNQIVLDGHAIVPFLKNCLLSYFIFGSAGHFWFFPALIFSLCLVTLLYKCKLIKIILPLSVILYVIGCLGCAYFEIAKHIPLLNMLFEFEHFNTLRRILLMAFPFFSMGYLLLKIEKRYSNKNLIIGWLISSVIFLFEIFLLIHFEIDATIVITFGLYILLVFTMLILLNNPLPQYSKISKISRTLANFTYYSHPMFQIFITVFSKFTNIKIPNIIEFIFTICITFSLGYILHLLKERKNWKIVNFIIG